jgi:hypothetical protein
MACRRSPPTVRANALIAGPEAIILHYQLTGRGHRTGFVYLREHAWVRHTDELYAEQARLKAHATAGDPVRRAKIADAKRGKRRPTPQGWVPFGMAWTAEDDELVRRLPPAEAAELTGHTLGSVYQRRSELRVTRRRPATGLR